MRYFGKGAAWDQRGCGMFLPIGVSLNELDFHA
jgi:hypothetical protein